MDENNIPPDKFSRRDIVKGLATVPVLGAFAYAFYKKRKHERQIKNSILENLNLAKEDEQKEPEVISGNTIRLGLIGFGIRGPQIASAIGFMHNMDVEGLKEAASKNSKDTRYIEFLEQDDLNVRVTAVCDIFTVYAKKAQETGANYERKGAEFRPDNLPVIHNNYRELLADENVDAVVIATPDHWHAPISIDAAKAGKHIYCEKPLSWSVEETFAVREAVKKAGVTFQLGHQNRQTEA